MYQAFEAIEYEDNSVSLGGEVTVQPEQDALWLVEQLRQIANRRNAELKVVELGLFRHMPGIELALSQTWREGTLTFAKLFVIKRIS